MSDKQPQQQSVIGMVGLGVIGRNSMLNVADDGHSVAGYNSSLAIRSVFGVAWLAREAPVDMFLELGPTLQLTSPRGFGMDAGIGARYFFR